ncbi:MAG: LLM class F420-dependent oxidoreductase [Thaumarchaeota archaeon]|nr:LLM class F420-dependent oxidoreductase [Nitrososphaerota archaeon]
MTLKLGLFHPIYTYDVQGSETLARLGGLARKAESLGFDSLWLMDHMYQAEPQGKASEPVLDSWTTLGALAAVTSRIRLGTLVTANPFRSPAHLAKITATVDVLSGGRVFLGLGAGWHEEEARAYGIPFPPVAERLQRLEEAVQIILKMWTEERASFSGKFYTVQDAYCNPKPVQSPHPPLLVGGSGERKTLKIVAKYADACNLFCQPEAVRRKLDVLREHCKAVNRDYRSIMKTKLVNLFISKDRDEARRNRASSLRDLAPERIDQYGVTGTPEDILDHLQALEEVGIEYVMLHFEPQREAEALELFSQEVATRF